MQILKKKLMISQISCLPVWTAVFIPRIWANEFLYIPDFAFYNWIDFEKFHSYPLKEKDSMKKMSLNIAPPTASLDPVWDRET